MPVLPKFSMTPTIEEIGINHFMTSFVCCESATSYGHFSYVKDFYRRCNGLDKILIASMSAVGLAAIANTGRSSQWMRRAQKEYQGALRLTNAALGSRKEAIKDSTLLSIIILGIYETVAGFNQLSLKAWTEHINGAAALTKLRGSSQFDTPIGRDIFMQAVSHLLVSCIQREMPLPTHILELKVKAAEHLREPGPAWQLLNAMAEFASFRAAVRAGTLAGIESVVAAANRIDANFVRIFSTLPPSWHYKTVYTDADPELIYNSSFDIYYDDWIPQVWNLMRTCRILLHGTIRERLLDSFTAVSLLYIAPESTAQFELSTEILIRMCNEILRSVPQITGYTTRRPFPTRAGSPASEASPRSHHRNFTAALAVSKGHGNARSGPPLGEACGPPPPRQASPRTAGGYFLLWPLYVVGVARVSAPATRAFIVRRLRNFADVMGIKQGGSLADFLECQPVNQLPPGRQGRRRGEGSAPGFASWEDQLGVRLGEER
jgi:Fungal specific transcription factor domain